jgi:hypothetical protein
MFLKIKNLGNFKFRKRLTNNINIVYFLLKKKKFFFLKYEKIKPKKLKEIRETSFSTRNRLIIRFSNRESN